MLRDYEAVLKAAADPNRVRILKMLESGELCVCQIVAVLRLAQSTISKHLALLHAAGLVDERKEGRWVYFRLSESALNEYSQSLLPVIRGWLNEDTTIRCDAEKVTQVRNMSVEQLCAFGDQALTDCEAVGENCCG